MLVQLLPEIGALLAFLSDQFHGQISAFVSSHPTISVAIGIVAAIAARFAPPPSSTPKA